ncbi:MAG: TonB-dependent receptor, partial [Gemmatimonadota bacterium]
MIRGAPKPVGGHAPFALSFDIVILTSFLLGGFTVRLHAQQEVEAVIGGEVVDAQTGAPLPDAFVEIEGTRVGAFTDEAGRYQLAGLPPGRVVLRVRRIGYAVARLPLTLRAGERVTRRVELAVSALRMEDLRVTADVGGRAEGELGTADVIDEEAIENQTAVSLQGLLELIPGQPLAAPGLDGIQQFSLRSVPTAGIGGTGGIANQRSAFDLTSFGTSIVLDGVPLSNNANLQTLGPRGEVFIPTAAGGGIDLRRIPASTLERVEVIRGVPSVRYGDLTQGAVIVYTKAGRVEPRLSLQGDVRTTSGAAVGGERLGGGHTGTLTLDLTRTVLAPGRDDVGSRVSGQLAHRLATGQSPRAGLPAFALDSRLDFFQVLEDRPLEPDVLPGFAARSRDRGMRLSERARVRLGETSELRLTAALSATQQRSFSRSLHLPVSVPITDRLTEGTQEGEFLIGEYVSMVDVEGDPWQLFARLELDAETRLFASEHRLRPGVVLRREWADGAGIQFDVSRPPQIGFNGVRGFDRPRPYDAIPPLVASALYLDDRVTALFGGGDVRLDVQAGVRLDLLHDGSSWASGVRDAAFQPRLNVELSPLPWLRLRAGAGLTAKLPAVGDLFPGPQYFDVVNVNFFADDPAERLAVLST